MTARADNSPTSRPLAPASLAAWRATPEYRAARSLGIDMEALEFHQTLSPTERIERNDRFAALVRAARGALPAPADDHHA